MNPLTQQEAGVGPGTALPWAVHPVEAWVVSAADDDAPVCALRMATNGLSRESDAQQDAAYIVLACNAFPKLVEALESIATKAQSMADDRQGYQRGLWEGCAEEARAALRLTKGDV